MFTRCDFRHPRAALLLTLVCALCLSPASFAAGKGKKGKPVTPDKPTSKSKVADARKADSKLSKNARNKPEKNSRDQQAYDQTARGRDRHRKEQVAARDDKSLKDKKGARAASAKLQPATASRLVTRPGAAEKKPEKNIRAVVRNVKTTKPEKNVKAEKPDKTLKAEKTEKTVQNKSLSVVRKEPQLAAAVSPIRLGKFGKPPPSGLGEAEPAEHHTPVIASTEITIQTTKDFQERAKVAPPVPEVIEVHEYDPSKVGVDFTAGRNRPLLAFNNQNSAYNVSNKKIGVSMAPERITEIQQALKTKGYYTGEPTGTWDDATYDAMKRYQVSQKIDATGYPTAHSLKRLGLTSW